jgi:hypothetical protein
MNDEGQGQGQSQGQGSIAGAINWARREPLWALLFGLASIACVLPIWIGRYLPLLDYPNHLAEVFIWRRLHDPAWNFEPYYTTRFVPSPNWAQYLIVYALGSVVGDEAGQKLFLSIAVLALPASIALYARRMGRDPRLALFAFPLAWNVNLAHAFLSYVAGLPVLFFSLTLLDRHAERPSLARGALAAVAGAINYSFHLLTWGLFMAVGGVSALVRPRPWRVHRAIAAASPTAMALAAGFAAYRAVGNSDRHWQLGAKFVGAYNTFIDNVGTIPGWLIDFFPGHADEVIAAILFVSFLVLLISGFRSYFHSADSIDGGRPRWRLELAFLVASACYFTLPRSLIQPFYWYAINRRLAVVVVLFLTLLIRGRLSGWRAAFLFAVVGAAALYYPIDVARHFHRFNVRMRDFDEVMESVPRGKQVLPLMTNGRDPEVNIACFNQWSTWVQLRQGGYQQFNLDQNFPIIYKKQLAAPSWDQPWTFRFSQHGEAWDYFLIYGHRFDPFVGAHDRVRLIKQVGEWAMWERLPSR